MTLAEARELAGKPNHVKHDAGREVEYGRIIQVVSDRVLVQIGGDPTDVLATMPQYLEPADLTSPKGQ